jgi:hypothetical protein
VFNAKTIFEVSDFAIRFKRDISFVNSLPHIVKTSTTYESGNERICQQLITTAPSTTQYDMLRHIKVIATNRGVASEHQI